MVYRANIDYTGEILTGNFSWVLKKAMESLRGYLHDRLYYEYQSITILAGHMNGDAFIPDHIACCLYGHGIDHKVEIHAIKGRVCFKMYDCIKELFKTEYDS